MILVDCGECRTQGCQEGRCRNAKKKEPPMNKTETVLDFQEGQWWVSELDAMASHSIGAEIKVTADMKRAVAVVHNLLKSSAVLAKLAEKREPVAWVIETEPEPGRWPKKDPGKDIDCASDWLESIPVGTKLYAHPPTTPALMENPGCNHCLGGKVDAGGTAHDCDYPNCVTYAHTTPALVDAEGKQHKQIADLVLPDGFRVSSPLESITGFGGDIEHRFQVSDGERRIGVVITLTNLRAAIKAHKKATS